MNGTDIATVISAVLLWQEVHTAMMQPTNTVAE